VIVFLIGQGYRSIFETCARLIRYLCTSLVVGSVAVIDDLRSGQ
jgi:hypothetical protein